ncbi:nucleotide exchange factor GrpE [Lyngbya sp. PCC 8106]|uniref:nucleotide exchange factor GrpE n=1 Tax=Lyngbya sp. (strain PCC 8106) TaxID=313612 RepID=UPI0000EAA9BC|nr:GrpE protein [Lyngbya sp. PCC 8106]
MINQDQQEEMMSNPTTDTPEATTNQNGIPSEAENVSPEVVEDQAATPVEVQLDDHTSQELPPDFPESQMQEESSTSEQIQQELVALAQANQALTAQLDEINTQYRRLAADFENFRKRTQKEKEDLEVQIKCNTIKKLLPVIDNFERARSHIKPQTESEMNIHKSYQSVYKQMVESLKQLGVSAMRPDGEPFDPNLHEAVMREASETHPEGTVIEEMMRGYMIGERVLRHAMVKVATAPESSSSSETDSEAPAPQE